MVLRAGSSDTDVFEEIYDRRIYDLPPRVAVALHRSQVRVVIDLGGNIGLFATRMLTRLPHAQVISYEPDPSNLALLYACRADSPRRERWEIWPVAAGTDDRVAFPGRCDAMSRLALDGETDDPDHLDVAMADALPALADADFVKFNIEGGEWPILADARFTRLRARVILLEYHPEHCPGRDPRTAAVALLDRACCAVADGEPEVDGVGMLRACRKR